MQMKSYLLELINQNRHVPNYKLPSENQLALKFNSSRISAKHAFDVLLEENVIYRQRGRGTFIRQDAPETTTFSVPGSTKINGIALILPTLSGFFMSDLVEGMRHALTKQGLSLVIMLTASDQDREAHFLRIARDLFKGILLFPSAYNHYNNELLQMVVNGYPLVQVDRYLPGLDLSYVGCDHCETTYQAVQFLQKRGHKRIGFIGHALSHSTSTNERLAGFKKATFEMDPDYPGAFRFNEAHHAASPEGKSRSASALDEALMDYIQRMQPTAIISSSYRHASAIMRTLKRLGIENDVELMLYDNEFSTSQEFLSIRPFVIDQQPYDIGIAAADLVYALAFNHAKPQQLRLPARIYQVGCE